MVMGFLGLSTFCRASSLKECQSCAAHRSTGASANRCADCRRGIHGVVGMSLVHSAVPSRQTVPWHLRGWLREVHQVETSWRCRLGSWCWKVEAWLDGTWWRRWGQAVACWNLQVRRLRCWWARLLPSLVQPSCTTRGPFSWPPLHLARWTWQSFCNIPEYDTVIHGYTDILQTYYRYTIDIL